MSARQCEVVGCDNMATWERFFGGRMCFVCGDCRRAFQDANTPDPELQEVQSDGGDLADKRKRIGLVVDTVPEVQSGGPADKA